MNPADAELARQSAGGVSGAFEELVRRHEARVFGFLRHKTWSVEDAEDLCQKVFVLAFRNIGSYRPEFPFATWLFAIARRQAIAYYRGHKTSHPIEDEPVDSRTPATRLEESEERERVWTIARDCLSPDQFTALWLMYVEELPVREIAGTLGKSLTHAKVILHRARKSLGPQLLKVRDETGPALIPVPRTSHHDPGADQRRSPAVSTPSPTREIFS